ncbi:MAG: TolC family protein [Verrucomicrobia bacterium]|nr:TolC family protein [Verrucomicrobiota bacterium]
MRLALTLAFLSSATLLAAGPAAPAPAPASAAVPALTLRQAVDRALRHNLGLAVTRLDAWRALDAVDVSLSAFDPTFAWTNRLTGSRTPAEILAGDPADRLHDSNLSLSQRYSWGGTLSVGTGLARTWADSGAVGLASSYGVGTNVAYTQPLLAGGWRAVNLTALISARQSALRSRLSLRASALDLIRDAEIGYWTLASARALVAFRETSLKSSSSLLEQIRARRSLGDATILDELQAEADVAAQRVGVLNARQALDNAEMSLRRLLGQGTAEDVDQPLAVDPLPTTAVPAAAAFAPWIRVVADFDFATEIQRANIVQADALVAQAEQNDQPSLNLSVGSGRYGDAGAAGGGVSGGLDNYRRQAGWTNFAELRLSFPLGFREAEANLRAAARSRRQAELRLADVRQSLVFSARATWRELEAARARVEAATSALELQRQSYEGERARFAAGQSDLPRVLQAQAALDAGQLAWVQANLDARAASAKVARLDGSILPRHGFTLDAVELNVGDGHGLTDPLPPLTTTP